MDSQLIKLIKKYALYLFIGWTVIVACSFSLAAYYNHKGTIEEAAHEAQTHYELNISYRKVIASFGGVYVPMDKVAPNPHLVVPDRDITTTDGKRLTLVNPAYLTRIVFETIRAENERPVINKITSLKIRNPVNMPDEWERAALLTFEQGAREAQELTEIRGESYLRLMKPFIVEQSCLKCHGDQGYKVGDVRGGISIAIPMRQHFEAKARTFNVIALIHFLLWLLVSAGILVITKVAVKNAKVYEETKMLSLYDHLTGLANRRFLEIDLQESFDLSKRYGNPFSVIMADLDFFKHYNDTNGHAAGDRLLNRVGGVILRETRRTDLAARYGGEEFLVVLHQTGLAEALEAAERIRRNVEAEGGTTISLGVAVYHSGMKSQDDIVHAADKALYKAKQNGRNRVERAG